MRVKVSIDVDEFDMGGALQIDSTPIEDQE
jgi:hypothetical protein